MRSWVCAQVEGIQQRPGSTGKQLRGGNGGPARNCGGSVADVQAPQGWHCACERGRRAHQYEYQTRIRYESHQCEKSRGGGPTDQIWRQHGPHHVSAQEQHACTVGRRLGRAVQDHCRSDRQHAHQHSHQHHAAGHAQHARQNGGGEHRKEYDGLDHALARTGEIAAWLLTKAPDPGHR